MVDVDFRSKDSLACRNPTATRCKDGCRRTSARAAILARVSMIWSWVGERGALGRRPASALVRRRCVVGLRLTALSDRFSLLAITLTLRGRPGGAYRD